MSLPRFCAFSKARMCCCQSPAPRCFALTFPITRVVVGYKSVSCSGQISKCEGPFFECRGCRCVRSMNLSCLFAGSSFTSC